MGGFDDRGFTAFSMACDTMLRLRSSGARARDWFCIRGRSVEERTMVILGPARTIGQPQQGYHDVAQSPQTLPSSFPKRQYSQSNDVILKATRVSKRRSAP